MSTNGETTPPHACYPIKMSVGLQLQPNQTDEPIEKGFGSNYNISFIFKQQIIMNNGKWFTLCDGDSSTHINVSQGATIVAQSFWINAVLEYRCVFYFLFIFSWSFELHWNLQRFLKWLHSNIKDKCQLFACPILSR